MFGICSEGVDNITKAGEGKIDLFGLFQGIALSACFSYFLTSSQIDEIQSSSLFSLVGELLGDLHDEESVGSGAVLVHSGGSHHLGLFSYLDDAEELFFVNDVLDIKRLMRFTSS